jgi:hypothetical protein
MEVDGQYHAPAALLPENNRGNDPVRDCMGPGGGIDILEGDIPNSTGLETGIVQPDH